jgi:hypothetical protein
MDEISGIQTASDTDSGPNSIPSYHNHGIFKGRSSFDARNVMTINSTYDLPFGAGSTGIGKRLVAGWQVGGIITLSSGFTSTVGTVSRFSTLGWGNESPDLAPGFSNNPTSGTSAGCAGVAAGTPLGTTEMYMDPCAFTPPPNRTIGNLGRNTVIAPGRAVVDFTLSKVFAITEGSDLQFRMEGFNFFNRVNLGFPGRDITTSTFGKIDRTQTSARQIQLGLRYTF